MTIICVYILHFNFVTAKIAFILIFFIKVLNFGFWCLEESFDIMSRFFGFFKFPRVGFFFHQALSIGTVFVAS